MIRAIVADDERLARQKIRELASAHADVQIVAECANGKQALAAIREHRPDLLFLDIRMPGIDGFGVVRELRGEELPRIVFVTAHDEYAVEAFEVEAVDYLLKPFDRARFDRTVDRVRRGDDAGTRRRLLDALDRLVTAPDRSATHFVVRAKEKIVFIDPHDVAWIGAEGKYVRLHLTAAVSHLVRQSIAEVERRLDSREFLRITGARS